VAFIKRFHGRISSVHLKDRSTPEHGQKNLPWGTGDTPLKEILLTMRRERHAYPASIELEYEVPAGSDAVKETAKCLEFCNAALANA
jgi:sugar phosphate isomerase/epimerase